MLIILRHIIRRVWKPDREGGKSTDSSGTTVSNPVVLRGDSFRFSLSIMEIPVFMLDAFTNLQFKGNPAAICPLMHVSKNLYVKVIL